jgi:hypothetical protein
VTKASRIPYFGNNRIEEDRFTPVPCFENRIGPPSAATSDQTCLKGYQQTRSPISGPRHHRSANRREIFLTISQITRFSRNATNSPRDNRNSSQKISALCSPINGARREIRQGEAL